MSANIVISSYQNGDEYSILDLYKKCFGTLRSANYWEWRFGNTKHLGRYINLAWSADILVGHYAVTPTLLSITSTDSLTGLSGDTMTHPDYRGKKLFPRLAESVYGRMQDNGLAMVWGFPNRFSHRTFISSLQWADIHEIPMFRRKISDRDRFPSPSPNIKALHTIDARFDHLWNKVKDRYPILVKRDSHYLNWRFVSGCQNSYSVLGYEHDEKLLGYAVYKTWQNNLDLVDILSVDDEISLSLVAAIIEQAKSNKVTAINMWLNYTLPLHHKLERLGFVNEAPVTYFGAKVFKAAHKKAQRILDFKNWYLTMSDSDIF